MATRHEGRGSVWEGGQIVSLGLSSDGRTCRRGRSGLYKEGESALDLFPVSNWATYQGEQI